MPNLSMQQTQALQISNQQQQLSAQQSLNPSNNSQSNALSNFNPQSDFSLDFLENLHTSDSTAFTEQELLNSFDNDPGFNLQDIL